jgi:hypothetical protein
MSPAYTHGSGQPIQVVDKTRWTAKREYECAWSHDNPHTIKKGETYIRAVYKLDGRFESDHICLNCWCGVPENATESEDTK